MTHGDVLHVYDTTLRDGAQQEGLTLSVTDKLAIAVELDRLGIGYIEGGWPGANPRDTEFFRRAAKEITFEHAELAAFGSTRRAGTRASQDPQVRALLDAETSVVTLVAKSHVRHVELALRTTLEENLEMGAFPLGKADLSEGKERVYAMFPKLRQRRRQLAGKMSGGERQQVAMGSALMLNPKLLLLDEPTAALSPKLVDEIFERIARIRDTGIAILMVEQNARQSLALADRGYVLANGQNRHEGTGRELLDDPNVGQLYLGG